jgi:hypothetical protein
MKYKKAKALAVFLAVVLCLSVTALAAKPVSVSDVQYVPLREVCNAYGVDVGWDGATRTITLSQTNPLASLRFDGQKLTNTADGTTCPAMIVNDRTFVPADLITKLLGVTCQWNDATQGYEIIWGNLAPPLSSITIKNTAVTDGNLVISGTTSIDTSKSTYIQYYIGKEYDGTITECFKCEGFYANADGTFSASIPVSGLKGAGNYEIVLEQNPNSNTILAPGHWTAFTKDASGTMYFGDITSMDEISNLAKTVGMQIAASEFTVSGTATANNAITIKKTVSGDDGVTVSGTTSIDTTKSTYIQYYVGKAYEGTVSECIACGGFNANSDGTFSYTIPVANLKGAGNYELVLEQNPSSNTILGPSHWTAFTKDPSGKVTFGDITSMGEISNLALTVGMQTASSSFTFGSAFASPNPIVITSAENVGGDIVLKGTTSIDTSKSTYIQYYVGKEYTNTLSNCVVCAGFNVNSDGSFQLTIPNSALKGNGFYTVVLEQNPNSNTILSPDNWKAFYKDAGGNTVFGSISGMKEISNLALTVGMKTAETTLEVVK